MISNRLLASVVFVVVFVAAVLAPAPAAAQDGACADAPEAIEVNGATLHYVECGAGDPVIFVHGSTLSYQWALPHADALAERYRVIAYSRRFHVPNRPPAEGDEYALEQHVADLAALIERLDAGPAHVIGYSYGGYVGLGLALERPDLVRSLVVGEPPVLPLLSRTAVGSALWESWDARTRDPARQAFLAGDLEGGLRMFLDAVLAPGWFDSLAPPVRQAIVESAGPEFSLELTTDTDRYMPALACEDLGDVEAPTLLLTGETSPSSLYLVTAELEECLVGEAFVMVPETGHAMFSDVPFVNEVLLDFLEGR